MTPVYLNPPPSPFPLVELKGDQNLQLYLSPPQQPAASSRSAPSNYFLNSTTVTHQDQRVVLSTKPDEEPKPHDHKVNKLTSTQEGSSTDIQQASSSSSLHESAIQDHTAACGGRDLSFGRKEEDHGDYESASDNGSTVKCMSSKMRLMMNNSNCGSTTGSADNNNNKPLKFRFHQHQHPMHDSEESNSFSRTSNNTVRVCSDCNTTTTPLWRSGPRGPKSLCNACGIRQRKARRAMEAAAAAAAANGAAVATDTTSSTTGMKIKVQINKEKKARTSHVAQYRKQSSLQCQKKLICFKEFALNLSSKNSALQRVFPQDVEDAAILLMELSCGLVHN